MGADLRCPAASLTECPKQNPPLVLDTIPFEAMKGHWTQEGFEEPLGTRRQTVLRPSANVDLQPLGLTLGEEKSDPPFVFTPCPVKDRPKYASLSASQWLSGSGIPRPPVGVRWMQTCLRTIGLHRAIWKRTIARLRPAL